MAAAGTVACPAWLRTRLTGAGWIVGEIYRIYPATDTDPESETEVLFLGREAVRSGPDRPLTAYVANCTDRMILVGEGW